MYKDSITSYAAVQSRNLVKNFETRQGLKRNFYQLRIKTSFHKVIRLKLDP